MIVLDPAEIGGRTPIAHTGRRTKDRTEPTCTWRKDKKKGLDLIGGGRRGGGGGGRWRESPRLLAGGIRKQPQAKREAVGFFFFFSPA
jgi:hypothetical protein